MTAEQFRLLVEGVKDYAIFLLDRHGRVVSWNAGAERIKGYTAAEIVGEHFARFYQPQDVAAGRPAAALARAAREGHYQDRGWRVRKDGSRFYAHVTLTALFDEQGQLKGFAKITRDVTVEREAEQVLREREHQLAQAQAIAQLGSFEWDLATGQVVWSLELRRIYGLNLGPVTTTVEALVHPVHPDDQAVVAEALCQAAGQGISFRTQARIRRPTGELRVVASWGEVTCDEQARPWRVRGVCQDVTDWQQREEQLAEAHAQAELSRRLQRSLLPTIALPDSPLRLATRYQPGQQRALLGADFVDTLGLPDGTVHLLIGDVAGHGPDGAAVGVALRAAWRALVLTGHGPAELLDGLDQVLVRERPSEEMFTTVCCTRISPNRDQVTVAVAGHPPPLLVQPGRAQVVSVPSGPALGIDDHGYPWQTAVLQLPQAWTLLCYTDGLIDGHQEPGSVERFGMDALAQTVAKLVGATSGLDDLLDHLLGVVHTANGGHLSDDVAILGISHSPPHAQQLPSTPAVNRTSQPGAPRPS